MIYERGQVVKGREALFVSYMIKEAKTLSRIHKRLMRTDKNYAKIMKTKKFDMAEVVKSSIDACYRLGNGSISVDPKLYMEDKL